ncbi:MAG: Fe-S cluster assembly ATPase SufC [Novosphingobium sp.]|uniref:Fe-S cluster assembly ATPase SufC n=1 Tax=Novosphingobium sp. TaxID=1874826 RepID=UPI0026253989|nr:Fe-S cluster assembly ATPase SufC [Novosphingobium sp.]MCP5387107.1 Fe-S cluster assembly ATPase SufC [Novosphingobium sp.]
MLTIDNLHASVADKPILKGLSLMINAGEVHAIMGPNGAGKSTLGYTLGGRPGYEVSSGNVVFDGQDLLALEPHERAAAGLFLGFQYPVEIPGVSFVQFLRESLNAQRTARGEEPLSGGEFLKLAREKAALLKMDIEMLKRPVNLGFSGGEKKRAEMVQMGILDPKLAILDETDSGLDIDALRIVGEGINAVMRKPDKAVLLITHYQRLLDYVRPDFVHVLADGRIVRTGGPELALELEERGYEAAA